MGKIPLPQQDTSNTAVSDMEKLVGVQHKNKSPKRPSKASGGGGGGGGSNKKKAVKVVYISNPMRVTTSAAAFSSLVQKLTGRDSNVADMDLPPYSSSPDEASVASTTGSGSVRCSYHFGGGDLLDHGMKNNCGGGVDSYINSPTASPFGSFDEAFRAPPQLTIDSFPGFMSSTAGAAAGLYYEPQVVGLQSFADM